MTHTRPVPIVACLSGDGIGPEVMAEAGRVIDTAGELFGVRVRQVHLPFGGDAIDKHGDPVPVARARRRQGVRRGAAGRRRRPALGDVPARVPSRGCSSSATSSTRSPTCARCATATST